VTIVVWMPPGDEEARGTMQGNCDGSFDINQVLKY
jgi:hypothetical protein